LLPLASGAHDQLLWRTGFPVAAAAEAALIVTTDARVTLLARLAHGAAAHDDDPFALVL